jgi:hypothetical protein
MADAFQYGSSSVYDDGEAHYFNTHVEVIAMQEPNTELLIFVIKRSLYSD